MDSVAVMVNTFEEFIIMSVNKNICAVAVCPNPKTASYFTFPKDQAVWQVS